MLNVELSGRKKRGRPQGRFMHAVREDMQSVGVAQEDAGDKVRRRMMICCGDSLKGAAKRIL